MKQKRCTELQIPILKGSNTLNNTGVWSLIELASLYTVPLSAVNGLSRRTTTSNGQTRPIRKFSNRPITFESNRNGRFEFESNLEASQVPRVDIMTANLVGVLPGALDHPVPRSRHTSTAPSPASSCDADHNSSTRTVSHRHCMQSHDRITSGSELLWGWKGVDPPSSPLVGLAHHPWGWQKRSQ